ncbi:Ras-specific guanine nucleotide-releasing factor 1 [Amphibalanus amphitrite]|uniref:Ras-specific guanine nucleotide-releasing factor 1 n=1 Tax=Amphibalanus amphitrite TaxID=1232801 RepID=A0A6A4V1F4_AMPAM|nr:Ras-specific guanine nucleotide-releasing factor 1 [Amphibalanus amphitrite]
MIALAGTTQHNKSQQTTQPLTTHVTSPSPCAVWADSETSSSTSSLSDNSTVGQLRREHIGLDFKLIVERKGDTPLVLHLVAPTAQEKAAWVSDIAQCLDNVQFNNWFRSSVSDTSSVTMPHSIRNDPKLFRDDIDIRFSKTLNSCKVPQVRYATPERLLERLTDLRFLSIDFLNTFLLTYRVFTDGVTVLNALKTVYFSAEKVESEDPTSPPSESRRRESSLSSTLRIGHGESSRRISTASTVSLDEEARGTVEAAVSSATSSLAVGGLQQIKEQPSPSGSDCSSQSHFVELRDRDQEGGQFLSVPSAQAAGTGAGSDSSTDTLVGTVSERTVTSQTSAEAGGARSDLPESQWETVVETRRDVAAVPIATDSDLTRRPAADRPMELERTLSGPPELEPGGLLRERNDVIKEEEEEEDAVPEGERSEGDGAEELKSEENKAKTEAEIAQETRRKRKLYQKSESIVLESEEPWLERTYPSFTPRGSTSMSCSDAFSIPRTSGFSDTLSIPRGSSAFSDSVSGIRSASEYGDPLSTPRGSTFSRASEGQLLLPKAGHKRLSTNSAPPMVGRSDSGAHHTPRTSFQYPPDSPQSIPRAGVVVTSSRQSQRRSSSSSAASAFAIATAGSSNPRDHPAPTQKPWTVAERRQSCKRQESIVSTAATMRVLNVLRHWVSKHFQDFESDTQLKNLTIEFLEDVMSSRSILPTEHKAASQLYHMITREEPVRNRVTLDRLLAPPLTPSEESIDTLSALDIAEQMTYLDHQIFMAIRSEEFLCQNWMKPEKTQKAPHIVMITRRFNEMSMLVVSSILKNKNSSDRVQVIEKWAAVGDICRCLQNFNGVLQICAAFTNTPVFRLKRTWEKVSKTAKQTVSRLQKLVSFEGNFRNLRDTLHRCDPPCIPYLGMYLTELSFIEEGTPNFTDDGLLNFAKMRMVSAQCTLNFAQSRLCSIAHVIRENRRFQQTPYKIEYKAKVSAYLLDASACGLSNDDLYEMSLSIEPRTSRISSLTVPSSHGGDGASKIKPRLSMGNLGRTLVYNIDSRRSSFS